MIYLLLNVLIVLFCTFMYYMFLLKPELEKRYRQLLISVVSMIAITLCMMFPFADLDGNIYDLRALPFLIGALYGGRKVAITLFFGVITVRLFMGINLGFYITVVHTFIMFLYTYYFSSTFKRSKFSTKLLSSIIFVSFIYLLNYGLLFFYFDSFDEYKISILLNKFLVLILSLILILYIIEYLLQNFRFKEELNEAEKLRVVSQLAASVSHEVRNPLTVTRGFLQLLKDENIDTQKRRDYLNLSLQELDRAQTIITDYLTYARPSEEINFIKLELWDEIEYVVKVMRPYALMFGVDIDSSDVKAGTIIGDTQKFRQCLINLTKNGIEAMPNGGKLSISANSSNKEVQILIKDTGIGMSQDQIEMVGVPYQSTKKTGTGLGTMVAINIIKSMNGTIEVTSMIGSGTNITLTFPNAK
ncbi:sensor histidine kinase [Anaerobacillus alkaliphilus]|uniref:histidine kinase n=1 Tax=Anaerobacillus alkaliphilus TaxID=1548597 RepID=A0A4Q0VQI1_9BACI|nr:sensor histidine kinase [Anaerobacillus alkaliphilus]RXI98693.1 sensor histidine kinase [Anaerobacillus alkaliphilus]